MILAFFAFSTVWIVLNVFPNHKITAFLIFGILYLLPGRIQGIFYRNHFKGRRYLELQKLEESILASETFLEEIKVKPWLKKLIFLSWGIYSLDIEAMTLNNLGAAQLEQGDLEKARKTLLDALTLDPLYPIPHVNLAILAMVYKDEGTMNYHIAQAETLGYLGTSIDKIVERAQSIYAKFESKL